MSGGRKALAIDYGSARSGVAVSDATGLLARPLGVVERVDTTRGMAALCAIIEREEPELIVVGLPLTLRGEHGPQAEETLAFVRRLEQTCQTPILTEDERYTTAIARRIPSPTRRPRPDDPLAAAVLLQGFLDRRGGPGASG